MPFASSESRRRWSRGYYVEHAKQVLDTKKRWRTANLEKRRAQVTLNNAIRSGRVQRGPCEYQDDDCTPNATIQGHHEDYSKPLDARWLCPWHHKRVDLGDLP